MQVNWVVEYTGLHFQLMLVRTLNYLQICSLVSLGCQTHEGRLAVTRYICTELGWTGQIHSHTLLRKQKMVTAVLLLDSENRCSVCALAFFQYYVNILALFVHCRGVQISASASKCSSVDHCSDIQQSNWKISSYMRNMHTLNKDYWNTR